MDATHRLWLRPVICFMNLTSHISFNIKAFTSCTFANSYSLENNGTYVVSTS